MCPPVGKDLLLLGVEFPLVFGDGHIPPGLCASNAYHTQRADGAVGDQVLRSKRSVAEPVL